MNADPETIALYDARASDYANSVSQPDNPRLDAFLDALPSGASVLDLGCGPGNAAAHMADRGFAAHAIDASAAMIDLASARPGVIARHASFDDLTEIAAYDAIWASFSLLHAPRRDMPRYLAALHLALRKAGHLMIGLKTGKGAARDSLGRLYTYYTRDEIVDLLTAAGFDMYSEESGEEAGLDGVVAPWIILMARRCDA